MTGEDTVFATEILRKNGAKDVFTLAAGMKKNRPGTVIVCLCGKEEQDRFARLMFEHTTTIGIRVHICGRYVLSRREETRKTVLGDVRRKISEGYGVHREKTEFEDLARIAERSGSI